MLRKLKLLSNPNTFRCLCSAVLLILAFPKTDLWILAWGGLIPLLITLDGKTPRQAFGWSYFCGFLFFSGTLFWFFHLTQWFSYIAALGILLLLSYLSLYFGIFGLCVSLFSRRQPLLKLVLIPSVWVCLEFVRGHLFTGFDWVCLGHSQYKNLPMIQIADVTGVYGISFLLVMVNVMLKELINAIFIEKSLKAQKALSGMIGVTAITVVFVLGYGLHRLSPSTNSEQGKSIAAAVVQANTPQKKKWERSAWPEIMAEYIFLTDQAVNNNPDLIIWPETSYPGYLWDDKTLFNDLQEYVRRIETPLLLGSVMKNDDKYFNTAMLLSEKGEVQEIYRKVHLVPFGEFLPLRNILPFLANLVGIGDFTAGDQWTTFSLPSSQENGEGHKFSVLICFEDTVARLSRQFVRQGAQLLVNITNDAWFGDSRAPFMHLQSSVFRTIENRRPLVRAANTGVSCFIDRWGRIADCVEAHGPKGLQRTYVSGFAHHDTQFHGEKSFYTKYGDVFTFFCFGCILLSILRTRSKRNQA